MKLSPKLLRKALSTPAGASLKTRAMLVMLGVGLAGVALASLLRSQHEARLATEHVLGMALQDLLLVLALGLVFVLMLERALLRPLRRLAEQAHAFDPTQPPQRWLEDAEQGPRELQQINQAFERVQQSLGAQLQREHSRAERLHAEVEQREAALDQARLALEAAQRELASLSRHDALTGLANRREFDDALRREFKRAQRQHGRLALAVMDLDGFRAYNEALGRAAGDAALQAFARLLGERFKRDTDLVARLGGEEFGALLPGCDRDMAQGLMEQLREELRALGLTHPASATAEPLLTVSIGLAAYRPGQTYLSSQALLQAADEALYMAKHAGRDRLSMAA
ncbi:diguanylate cyclase [Roseateles sp. DAIF2]|uniref:GGDEF domain-containing protein n=1 Tax=Roseateles sp. DAIF2 TaxID=2714952 RepID=UPI0018A33760|nr:GGDEF domain-containing protein [Roseateles sp. DAIF2]QPF76262.1 diguanylate cyclase [Roseateles sp. DAIF2]